MSNLTKKQKTQVGKIDSNKLYPLADALGLVKEFATAVRRHWSIESMHWILDVVFGEDASRLRNGHATENFGFLRKFILSLLRQDTSSGSLKVKRKRAGWSTDFLESVLFFKAL